MMFESKKGRDRRRMAIASAPLRGRGRWLPAAGGLLLSCGSLGGVQAKPCRPGCVDDSTRLECAKSGAARAVPCPKSPESCAASMCQEGTCSFRPAVGAPCGPKGLAQCNEGYACLGPDLKLTAILQHTCALADDGKIWCWGGNLRGELGDGTTEARGNPVLVRGLPRPAIAVSAGYASTCALLDGGEAYCWGDNTGGQSVPDSIANPVLAPTLVSVKGVHFTSIHAGQGHTCGIADDATVYCWGNTTEGQCGIDGTATGTTQVPPTQIPNLDHVTMVETVKNHTCAVRSTEPSLVCWGSNEYLEGGGFIVHKLGPGAATLKRSAVPVPVDLGSQVVDVGMGYESTFAVAVDGRTYAWGLNNREQLGTESTEGVIATPSPVMVEADGADAQGGPSNGIRPLLNVRDVLRSDGSDQCAEMTGSEYNTRYLCWGGDDHGELGFGVATGELFHFATPTKVLPPSARNMVHGEDHACVIADEGAKVQIWCYGKAPVVGSGSTDPSLNQPTPTPIVWVPENFAPALQ